MSEQPGRYQRSFSGLVGSMLVLLLVVGAFVAFRALTRDELQTGVQEVPYADDLDYYRSQADFPLLAPPDLPEGWKATSVRFNGTEPQSWHLGVLTDEEHYVGIEQARDTEPTLVGRHVDEEAVAGEPVTVNGVEWDTYTDEGGDVALVRRDGDVTTLVVGTLPRDELIEYVETLR